jgi:hypothetical protein
LKQVKLTQTNAYMTCHMNGGVKLKVLYMPNCQIQSRDKSNPTKSKFIEYIIVPSINYLNDPYCPLIPQLEQHLHVWIKLMGPLARCMR